MITSAKTNPGTNAPAPPDHRPHQQDKCRDHSLALMLQTKVVDASGKATGKLRDLVLTAGEGSSDVRGIVVKTHDGTWMVDTPSMTWGKDGTLELLPGAKWNAVQPERSLLAVRDLLDQQIIDVSGRKVVRVNDVDLQSDTAPGEPLHLSVRGVEIGTRGAVRRILRGGLPTQTVESLADRFTARTISWHFVNLIETDPARRVHLKIEQTRLQNLHPSDIADILEDLPPAERQAVFIALDEDVAAEALEEVSPQMQRALVSGMDSERAADIVEEMDPAAAADLLAELPEARSEAILEQMNEEERHDVEELLEFKENTAAGRMTLDYLELPIGATAEQALRLLREYEGGRESLTTAYVIDAEHKLTAVVPLARLALAAHDELVETLGDQHFICVNADVHERDVAELFDKYNLLSLPVMDAEQRLSGVIHAHEVISYLRRRRHDRH